jgi:23S rRNA pseudouridine1911/1915/1917 synthase
MYWLDDLSGIAGVERPGIVHRLDKETTGVIVVAKHDVAHQSLSHQFRERQVHKTYLAISRGKPMQDEGRMSFPLGRSLTHRKKQTVRNDGRGRAALTDYRVLETFDGYCLIECYPTTGRTHQIRVHLGTIHLPVACDKLYGREREIHLCQLERKRRPADSQPIMSRHALHAASISFCHPVSREEVSFSAPLHDDMLGLLHALQRYRSPR